MNGMQGGFTAHEWQVLSNIGLSILLCWNFITARNFGMEE